MSDDVTDDRATWPLDPDGNPYDPRLLPPILPPEMFYPPQLRARLATMRDADNE